MPPRSRIMHVVAGARVRPGLRRCRPRPTTMPARSAPIAARMACRRCELDSRLNEVALKQARAMAATGTVSHSVGGSFLDAGGGLAQNRGRRKYRRGISEICRNAEAVGRQRRPPRESPDGRRAQSRRRVGGQSEIAVSEVLGDGDYGLAPGRASASHRRHSPPAGTTDASMAMNLSSVFALLGDEPNSFLQIPDAFRNPRPVAGERMLRAIGGS